MFSRDDNVDRVSDLLGDESVCQGGRYFPRALAPIEARRVGSLPNIDEASVLVIARFKT